MALRHSFSREAQSSSSVCTKSLLAVASATLLYVQREQRLLMRLRKSASVFVTGGRLLFVQGGGCCISEPDDIQHFVGLFFSKQSFRCCQVSNYDRTGSVVSSQKSDVAADSLVLSRPIGESHSLHTAPVKEAPAVRLGQWHSVIKIQS